MTNTFCITHSVRMNVDDYQRCTFGLERGEPCEMRRLDEMDTEQRKATLRAIRERSA